VSKATDFCQLPWASYPLGLSHAIISKLLLFSPGVESRGPTCYSHWHSKLGFLPWKNRAAEMAVWHTGGPSLRNLCKFHPFYPQRAHLSEVWAWSLTYLGCEPCYSAPKFSFQIALYGRQMSITVTASNKCVCALWLSWRNSCQFLHNLPFPQRTAVTFPWSRSIPGLSFCTFCLGDFIQLPFFTCDTQS
jgi:hypothetical protein